MPFLANHITLSYISPMVHILAYPDSHVTVTALFSFYIYRPPEVAPEKLDIGAASDAALSWCNHLAGTTGGSKTG